jgi:monooxygenase
VIRYGHRVQHASWSTADALWSVEAETGADKSVVRFTCNFLYLCTGYYDYEAGYTPDWSDVKRFRGQIVHPQKWPEVFDYEGKRVVVIGSGATAVTLVPAMAEKAAHVTMLQRSPTYVVSRPAEDRIANGLRSVLPAGAAYALTRWKNVLLQLFFYNLPQSRPDVFKWMLARGVRNHLGSNTTSSTSRQNITPGISVCAWSLTRICSTRYATAGQRWSPTRLIPSPSVAYSSSPASTSTLTLS